MTVRMAMSDLELPNGEALHFLLQEASLEDWHDDMHPPPWSGGPPLKTELHLICGVPRHCLTGRTSC